MAEVNEQLHFLEIPQLWVRLLCAGILCAAALVFFVSPLLFGVRHAGCYAGITICTLAAVFFLCNRPLSPLLGRIWTNTHGRVLLCIVAGFLSVCVLFAAVTSIQMVRLLVDYYNCQEITVNPAQSAPQSGVGVDGYFLTVIL